MPRTPQNEDEKPGEAPKDFGQSSLRQYGRYSSIVFQMLATMGLGFWGGKKINDYYGIESNLLTIAIGFAAMGLAFYSLIKQLNKIQKNETKR